MQAIESHNGQIKVVYWHGTNQRSQVVDSYEEAMELVDEMHQNAASPRYYDAVTGTELVDAGGCFVEGN